MLKLVYCIYRKPSLSREEFNFYWEYKHAPLVKELADYTGACRYVQSYRIDSKVSINSNNTRGILTPEYDGFTELWWQSEADLVPSGFSKEELVGSQKKLFEDEKAFIDFERSVIVMTRENVIFDSQ